jgi:hypothetical protein
MAMLEWTRRRDDDLRRRGARRAGLPDEESLTWFDAIQAVRHETHHDLAAKPMSFHDVPDLEKLVVARCLGHV